MSTAQERIFQNLANHPLGLCDDCLSEVANVVPRQQVNQKCRPLAKEGRILRTKGHCPLCKSFKLVNTLPKASTPMGLNATSPQPPPVPTSPSSKNSQKVKTIFRKMEDILDEIKPRIREQDNATRIGELIREGLLPRHIGSLMHSIRVKRNEVEHDRYEPDDMVMNAIEAEWRAISDWWHRQSKSQR
jgi:hypothetical protein